MNRIALGIGLICLGGGCASFPPPHQREASSEAAIRTAKEMGAEQMPQAALHLKLAQEELTRGQALMKDGDNERADSMLMRAQADAELSLGLARGTKTQIDAQQVIDRVRAARGNSSSATPMADPTAASMVGASVAPAPAAMPGSQPTLSH